MYILDTIKPDSVTQRPSEDAWNDYNQTGYKLLHLQGFYGQNTVIAIIDSGIRGSHVMFKNTHIIDRINIEEHGINKNVQDDLGHGSHVAGTITKIAPKASLLIVKVLDGQGYCTIKQLIDAVNVVANWIGPNGETVDVLSMSLSVPAREFKGTELKQFENAFENCKQKGIFVAASAGNTGTKDVVRYPSYFDYPVTVGAVDANRNYALFSTQHNQVDLCQVGVGVLSAYHLDDISYCSMDGTSMATPKVASMASVLASKYKYLMGLKKVPEAVLYGAAKGMFTINLDVPGVDVKTGAGFFTFNQKELTEIRFKQGSKVIYVNGTRHEMDAPVTVVAGRTSIPLRAPAEYGATTVQWIPETQEAIWML